jgi:mono/diheme cytochrome c family protein
MKTMSSAAIAALVAISMAFPIQAEQGAELYAEHCVRCHGEDGRMGPRRDLTSAKVQDKSDKVLLAYIADGRGHGYAQKGLRASQIQFLVDHLRALASAPPPETTENPDQ